MIDQQRSTEMKQPFWWSKGHPRVVLKKIQSCTQWHQRLAQQPVLPVLGKDQRSKIRNKQTKPIKLWFINLSNYVIYVVSWVSWRFFHAEAVQPPWNSSQLWVSYGLFGLTAVTAVGPPKVRHRHVGPRIHHCQIVMTSGFVGHPMDPMLHRTLEESTFRTVSLWHHVHLSLRQGLPKCSV